MERTRWRLISHFARSLAFAMAVLSTLTVHAVPPGQQGVVTDLASALSPEQQQPLEALLHNIAAHSAADVRVLIVSDLGREPIEHFAKDTFQSWRVGSAQLHGGALIVLDVDAIRRAPTDIPDQRFMWIHLGSSIVPVLPRARAQEILDQSLAAARTGDFDLAVTGAVRSIADELAADPSPLVAEHVTTNHATESFYLFLSIVALVASLSICRRIGLLATLASEGPTTASRMSEPLSHDDDETRGSDHDSDSGD